MGQLTFIEMVAYQAMHSTHDLPWRCMVCEILTPHSDASILDHLWGAHNLPAGRLAQDKDGCMFLSPEILVAKNLTGNSQEELLNG